MSATMRGQLTDRSNLGFLEYRGKRLIWEEQERARAPTLAPGQCGEGHGRGKALV